jgi:hypothetical protein
MLKNEDLDKEIWGIIQAQHWVITDLASRIGISSTNFYRLLRRPHIDAKMVEMLEVMGYDVEVRFVRRAGRKQREQ